MTNKPTTTESITPGRPRLLFVGQLVGRNPGYITTQGQILADLFNEEGYNVIAVSSHLSKVKRLLDIITTLVTRRNDYDIMVLDVYGGLSFVAEDVASTLARLSGKAVIMCLRGGAMPEFSSRHPAWARRVLGRAAVFMAPSEFLVREMRRYGVCPQVIPNVIDISAYRYRHRTRIEPRLFWMRSFHEIYNPELAIKTLARLRHAAPEATLVMGGPDKGLLAPVKQLAAELGVEGAVRFAGFLDREGKAREGDAADMFLNTNRVDNMPVSVVEACAMGLPVVATAVGGVPDLLKDGENALLVPDDDDEAMCAAIMRLLNDPELTSDISQKARMLAERSSWEQVLPQWEALFRQAGAAPARQAR